MFLSEMSEIHVNNDVKTQRMKDYVRQLHNHGTETWRCLLVKVKWQILMILIDDIWFQENIHGGIDPRKGKNDCCETLCQK